MSNKFNMTFGETYKVLEDGYQEGYKQGKQDALASINDGRLQQKIVTPSKEIQVIKADDGYYGLSDVIVSPPVIDSEGLLEAINSAKNNINEVETNIINKIDEKWELEDFINEVWNRFKTNSNYINVYLFDADVFTYVEEFTSSNKIWIYDREENIAGKEWIADTSKATIIDDRKIGWLVLESTSENFYSGIIRKPYTYDGYNNFPKKNDYAYLMPFVIGIKAESTSGIMGDSNSNNSYANYVLLEYLNYANKNVNSFTANGILSAPKLKHLIFDRSIVNSIGFGYQSCYDWSAININVQKKLSGITLNTNKVGFKGFKAYHFPKITTESSINGNLLIEDVEEQFPDYYTYHSETNWSNAFEDCQSLKKVKINDNATNISYCFAKCFSLKELDLLHCKKISNFQYAFQKSGLETLKLDFIGLDSASNYGFIDYCMMLTNLTILNIKVNTQVGSGSSWGYKLSLESLIGLCQECINVGSSRTLTVGSTNITKLKNVYVKLTGEPEENETLPKIPMVQCESTDDGAMLIKDYMALKSWTLA